MSIDISNRKPAIYVAIIEERKKCELDSIGILKLL